MIPARPVFLVATTTILTNSSRNTFRIRPSYEIRKNGNTLTLQDFVQTKKETATQDLIVYLSNVLVLAADGGVRFPVVEPPSDCELDLP